MPEDALAVERYLGSGAIKGIGAALAARIVRRFGDDTMRIVEEEPERLAEIKGISEKKAMEIAEQMTEKADMRRAMIFLQKYGISLNLGAKIYQKYGQSVYGVLQENPYRLAEDISGVGFRIADDIASRIGIHTDSDYRIRSGMLYTLLQASGEGHIYLPKEELFSRASRLLGVDVSYMEKHLMDMVVERKLILKETEEGTVVYPKRYYNLELDSARMLCELNILCPEDEYMIQKRIERIEKETGTKLDEMQKQAVISAAQHGLFILTGGPGTGKTTTAKILARAVNCLNPQDGEPCNECEICKAALDGSLTDIVEMDAASNNSVEDIRSIREEVNFLPTKAKYRVYIIDEVHMLSQGAFNALLKTLEEPPEHVKFILATTEPQKLPATILSRCQRFDFKRIPDEDIIKRLELVCKESNVNATTQALNIIAALSEGAMRDALSILERCIQDGENNIDENKIKELVGIPKLQYIHCITQAIVEYNIDEAMETITKVLKKAKDIYDN